MRKAILVGCVLLLTKISWSQVYTFNGKWSDSSNWLDKNVPPDILPINAEIIISPSGSGECIVDVFQYISKGAKLTIQSGKAIKVLEDFIVDNSVDTFSMTVEDIDFLDSIAAVNPTAIILSNLSNDKGNALGVKDVKDDLILSMLSYSMELSVVNKGI